MLTDLAVREFVDEVASSEPVPGGGGVSALVGALGISLGDMVGELTVGKPKYADVEDEIKSLMERAQALKDELLRLVDADAEAFKPLAKAYSIPKDNPDREAIMEEALLTAASVPMDIVKACASALDVIEEFSEKGSRLAISDAGCAASLCKSAMESAALNVYINTKYMSDREVAANINSELDELLNKYTEKADRIFNDIVNKLK